jgi:ABC-type multidrug transport system fused ATPase/permease subunit
MFKYLQNKIINLIWFKRTIDFGLNLKSIFLIIILGLTVTVTEIFGVGIFLPIFQFIRFDGNIEALTSDSIVWEYIISTFGYLNLEVSLSTLLVLAFIVFLSRQGFVYLRITYQSLVNLRIVKNLRDRMFRHYLAANTSYHDSLPVGGLVNTMTTEINTAASGIMIPLEIFVLSVTTTGYLAVLSVISWEMTLASVIVLILSSQLPRMWIKMSTITGRHLTNTNTDMSSFLVGRLGSPRLVRLSGTNIAEQKEFHDLTQLQLKHSFFGSVLKAKTESIMEPVIIGLSLIFLYLSYAILHLSIEEIGVYLLIALRLMPIMKNILRQWQVLRSRVGAVEAVENRLGDMKLAKEHDIGGGQLSKVNNIRFENIFYRYPSANTDTLSNLFFEIPVGRITALVGPSGSGKSTLIDLLPNLRQPKSGHIVINNLPVDKYSLQSLRSMISYAPQNPQIFNGKVSDHIRYGKLNASDTEVKIAASIAGAHEFIERLPHNYHTVLGDNAIELSGGQRQRLDLARALVGKKPILILDEPTSGLDIASEDAFSEALNRIRSENNITIIIVTHKLSSVVDADQIIVLNKGEIESIGKHEELLNKSNWYAMAWKLQFK